MDQKELRTLEQRCVQEEPPPCMAACPIHVELRRSGSVLTTSACLPFTASRGRRRSPSTIHAPLGLSQPCRRACVLRISPEVREGMEERRILIEDLQKVIDHAEETGRKLYGKKTGYSLASFKPCSVTYWAEYSKTPDGYTVHNAYSHRMEIVRT
ncbi:MAG: hypothetical protein A4E63_02109 [Syntrophorhabdus sp. PtaU1.Bin050]|nr:MAG: hypothetical protein A4E63_02109 [Syntrophorhabdus sp. PtaU1.Bin050]